MVGEYRVVRGSMEGFSGELYMFKNLDLGCAHVKFYQAEHLRFVLLNVCKLFLNKNNVTYIKKIKPKHEKKCCCRSK